MKLHAIEARLLRNRGCRRESAHQVADFVIVQGSRSQRTRDGRLDRARRDRSVAGEWRDRLAAGMVDLHPYQRVTRSCGVGPLPQPVDGLVVFDHDIAGLAQLLPIDHHRSGEDQAVAALRGPTAVQPDQLRRGVSVAIAQRFTQ